MRPLVPALLLALLALPATALPAAAQDLVVGVYAGPGTDASDRARLVEVLGAGDGIDAREVGLDELDGCAVLVIGGGGGTSIGEGLGAEGGAKVDSFVRAGGGFVGVGAGGYLGARGYNAATRHLELVDAVLVDRGNWSRRGEGEVVLEGLETSLGLDLPARWRFDRGPLFGPGRSHAGVPYAAWARHRTDLLADDPEAAGAMLGTDAIVAASYGEGRAVLFGVDPRAREETAAVLRAAARWAAGEGQAPELRAPAPKGLRVAILDDEGCIASCVAHSFRCLDAWPEAFSARRISARDVRRGALEVYDVVLLPGGSATGQSRGLGAAGRRLLKEFVARGGGYVGTCAGAYLGAAEPTRYGLGLAAVRCVDTKHWRRGTGIVDLEATPALEELTGIAGERLRMLYANGPLLEAMEVEGLPAVRPLARFLSDVHADDAPAGVMPGKLAALSTTYREGRVVLFSTHPELTRGMEEALVRAVRWAAGRESHD